MLVLTLQVWADQGHCTVLPPLQPSSCWPACVPAFSCLFTGFSFYLWLSCNSPYSLGWPSTGSNPPASVSQVLKLHNETPHLAFFLFHFETGSHYVTLAGMGLIFSPGFPEFIESSLAPPPVCWDSRDALLHLAQNAAFSMGSQVTLLPLSQEHFE